MRRMKKWMCTVASVCLVAALSVPALAAPAFAANARVVSGNDLVIEDKADLFTDSEEKSLQTRMSELCQYGDTIMYTIEDNDWGTESAADKMLRKYGNDGLVFVIDMDNREIYLFTTYDSLTAGHCRSITDNVFEYASDGQYYTCAVTAFDQAQKVLSGQRIAQPMKYIDNALLAVIIAMIINFIWLSSTSRKKRASSYEVAGNVRSNVEVIGGNLKVTGTRVRSSSSSGAAGGGIAGGGFSGGGGGHGGGHSF